MLSGRQRMLAARQAVIICKEGRCRDLEREMHYSGILLIIPVA
jgi:hypothetical protein